MCPGKHSPVFKAHCRDIPAGVTGHSSAGHTPAFTPCSWGRLLELAVHVGSVSHSNTPSVWFLREELHSQVSLEITTQPCIHRDTGTVPMGAAPPEPFCSDRKFLRHFHEFSIKALAVLQGKCLTQPRLKEGLPDTGRVEAGFIPASVRAEVYTKVQVLSYLEIFHRRAVPPLQQTRLWSHASKATDTTTGGLSVCFQNGF